MPQSFKLQRTVTPLFAVLVLFSCNTNPAETRDKHMKSGDGYFQEQEFSKAIIEYKNAIEADPKYSPAHYQLALSYLKTSQPQLAFSELYKTIDLDPDNLDAQLMVGQFYLLDKKTDEANERATLVLEREPQNIHALFLQTGIPPTKQKPLSLSRMIS